MTAPALVRVLRLAEAVPETPENYAALRELKQEINALDTTKGAA